MRRTYKAISSVLAGAVLLSLSGCARNPMGLGALENYAKKYGAEKYTDAREFSHAYKDAYGDFSEFSEGLYVRAKGDEVRSALRNSDELSAYYDENTSQAVVFVAGDHDDGDYYYIVAISMRYDEDYDADNFYYTLVNAFTSPGIMYGYDPNDYMSPYVDPAFSQDIIQGFEDIERETQELIEWLEKSGMDPALINDLIEDLEDTVYFDEDLVCEEFIEEDGLKYTLYSSDSGSYYAGGIYVKEETLFTVYAFGSDMDDVNERLDDVCSAMSVASPSSL